MRKSILTKFLVLTSLICLSTASFGAPKHPKENKNAQSNKSTQKNQTYLFVHSSTEATITQNNSNDNTYTITLKQVSPYVTYFSERPARKSGSMAIEKFLNIWTDKSQKSFKNDAPNAAIHATQMGASNQPQDYTMMLSNPQYNDNTKTLTYTGKPLEGNPQPLPQNASYQHITIFIDDACLSCW